MLTFPDINPVAIDLGPLRVHWYGIMYLLGFGAGWWLGRVRARAPTNAWKAADVDDVLFFVALGVLVGGRVGYILFYDLAGVAADPLSAVRVWQGGMSFHGGLLGVILAMWLFARRRGRTFFEVADFIAPLVPPGLLAGRLGNFINGNLWGKESDLPWAMVFPGAGDVPRHPSQLYEAFLEGLVLFVILWVYSSRPRPTMAVSGLFLLGYGCFRFLVEFVRMPDAHLGYLAGWITRGQLLTAPMILLGIALLVLAYRRGMPSVAAEPAPATPRPARRRKRR